MPKDAWTKLLGLVELNQLTLKICLCVSMVNVSVVNIMLQKLALRARDRWFDVEDQSRRDP